jgi:hypothetical protein
VNTFGALAGVILAGYQLLSALGNRKTLAAAVVANLMVGAVAIAYSRRLTATAPEAARQPAGPPTSPAPVSAEPPDLGGRLTLIALGVSGAVSMLYEVAWTRALAQVIGSSTYAFTAMLVAFLLGIVGGAAVYSRIWGERRASPGVFALIQCGIGVAAGLVLLGFDRMPALFLFPLIWSDSPAFVQFVQLAVSALALLPSTLLIGVRGGGLRPITRARRRRGGAALRREHRGCDRRSDGGGLRPGSRAGRSGRDQGRDRRQPRARGAAQRGVATSRAGAPVGSLRRVAGWAVTERLLSPTMLRGRARGVKGAMLGAR